MSSIGKFWIRHASTTKVFYLTVNTASAAVVSDKAKASLFDVTKNSTSSGTSYIFREVTTGKYLHILSYGIRLADTPQNISSSLELNASMDMKYRKLSAVTANTYYLNITATYVSSSVSNSLPTTDVYVVRKDDPAVVQAPALASSNFYYPKGPDGYYLTKDLKNVTLDKGSAARLAITQIAGNVYKVQTEDGFYLEFTFSGLAKSDSVIQLVVNPELPAYPGSAVASIYGYDQFGNRHWLSLSKFGANSPSAIDDNCNLSFAV